MLDLEDFGIDGVDLGKKESVQVSLSSLETQAGEVKRVFFSLPTCSCDYVKWSAKRYLIDSPDFGNGLRPTKIDPEEQCIYCGFYARWEKYYLNSVETEVVPFWALPSWFNAPDEPTWFTTYKKDLERLDQAVIDSEKESSNTEDSDLIESSAQLFIN